MTKTKNETYIIEITEAQRAALVDLLNKQGDGDLEGTVFEYWIPALKILATMPQKNEKGQPIINRLYI